MNRIANHSSIKQAAILAFSLFFFGSVVRGQSALDGFDPNANDIVWSVAVQPDGKILVGGDFTALAPNGGPSLTRNKIARLLADGTVDPSFDPDADGEVNAIAVQADGKVLIGGSFTHVGGQARNGIARLDAVTGAPDTFDPNATSNNGIGTILSLVVQPDQKILVGGYFNHVGGTSRNHIARLDPTTGAADSFNPNADGMVTSIAIQSDGKILAGGWFEAIGGAARRLIARLDPATGLVDSFDAKTNNATAIYAIAIQADGKILVGGGFGFIGGAIRNGIARLDPNTAQADSFNPGEQTTLIYSMALQPDGKILVCGSFNNIGGQPRNGFARLDQSGLADSFNPISDNGVGGVAVQRDGKIVAVGQFHNISGQVRNRIARLETSGVVDQTFISVTPSLGNSATVISLEADGKILLAGDEFLMGKNHSYLLRLNLDGTVDSTFIAPHFNSFVGTIAPQPDNQILVGGQFDLRFIRFNPGNGLIDTSFHPNAIYGPYAIAIQSDGKILVSGSYSQILTRLNPDGSVDSSFHVDLNAIVFTICVQPDGKILIGGSFTAVNGEARNYIVRLNPDGSLDPNFNPFVDRSQYHYVSNIITQWDGKVLVGGSFANIGGQPRDGFARLDGTTGLADSLDVHANGSVTGIALQADGKIIVCGNFNNIGGQARNHVARIDGITGLADSFDPNPLGDVYGIALQSDGKIVASGNFYQIGGQDRYHVARLSNPTAATQDLTVSRTAIHWAFDGSSPQFTNVVFEVSTDNVNYTPVGTGVRSGKSWVITGLNLPTHQSIYVRALGFYGTGQNNASQTIAQSVRNTFLPQPATLGNISTRLVVQTGDNAMIGGFIITGTQPKTVIVRGLGPSLPLPGALSDPVIEVHGASGELLSTNDNWMDAETRQQIIDSGLAPTNDLESALWGIINPGAYTVVVRGNNNALGVGLFEVYDLDQTVDSKLANISTRGYVATGNGVMIGGTIIIGDEPGRILLRAIGPSLTGYGVPDALSDPTLELHDGNGTLIAANDNWRSDQEAEIIATGIPPSNDLESAILQDLAPGFYTAIVRGSNNTSGVGVVEAFELE